MQFGYVFISPFYSWMPCDFSFNAVVRGSLLICFCFYLTLSLSCSICIRGCILHICWNKFNLIYVLGYLVCFIIDFRFCWTSFGMASRRNVQYSRLATDEDDDGNGRGYDRRFDYTPKSFDKVPWKSIALALFLLSLGSFLLFLSYFIFTGHMGGEMSQAYGLLALGILTFLPGMSKDTCISFFMVTFHCVNL